MGEPKQLLKWGNSNLLEHAITQAKQVSTDVFVVLGAYYENIAPKITGVQTIFNKNWELGMGSSIATGVRHIVKEAMFSHVLIMLADQPYLDAVYLKEMMDTVVKKPNGIIATQYRKSAGVPAVFSAEFFSELGLLNKDFGARKLMQRYEGDLVIVSPKSSTLDIDTKDVYLKEKPNNIRSNTKT